VRNRIRDILLVLLGSCALVGAGEQTAVWVDVPFVKQVKNGCGAASIAMVMQYWQRQQGAAGADAAEIQKTLYSDPARGIYASDMEGFFRQHGYRTFAFAGTMHDLAEHVAKGRPLIAGLQPSKGAALHYVVIAGVDPDKREVLINDPAERKLLKRDFDTFEKEWRGTGHWTLLAVPASGSSR
jgi:ABC-type bacteriocin/lantibiotic exporter with double-glycine peptidase domain